MLIALRSGPYTVIRGRRVRQWRRVIAIAGKKNNGSLKDLMDAQYEVLLVHNWNDREE